MKMVFMHKFLRPLVALVCMSALLLAGACGNAASNRPGSAPSGPLKIVVAFYPFQFIAQRVAGDHATIQNLTQPGAEPHDLELTPKQVASVGTADLVIYEKSFQAAVDEAVIQSKNPHTFDTSTVVPLQDLGTQEEPQNTKVNSRFLDPHVWLDANNVATIASATAVKLSAVDPTNAADYSRNATALVVDLKTLDRQYRTGLASCRRKQFITSHTAFGYLARRYQLVQVGISGLSPDSEPSPARIVEVQKEAKALRLTTIFYETLASPAVARAIAGDLGLQTDVLDPIEGITPQSRGKDYLAVMRANLASLRAANGCR
jgi:zinc transport system substrate-binding protein